MANRIKSLNRQPPPEPEDYSEVELKDNIFERVGIALYNTLRADPDAAIRSLLAPDTLPPSKRKKISALYGKSKSGMEAFVLNTLTNPLVIAGAAMSYRWPILDPSKYRTAAKTLQQYERYIPAPLRKLLGLNEVFAGTKIPELAARIPAEAAVWTSKHFHPVGEGILAFRKATGRKETLADEIRWALKADNTFSDSAIRSINRKIAAANKKGAKIPHLSSKDINIPSDPHDHLVLDPWRKAAVNIKAEAKANPEAAKRMANFSAKHHNQSSEIQWIEEGYFPRTPSQNLRATVRMKQRQDAAMLETVSEGQTKAEALRQHGRPKTDAGTARLLRRNDNAMIPDIDDLEKLPEGAISSKAAQSLRALRERLMLQDKPASYSLRFAPAVQSYGFSMGRAHAWSGLRLGEALSAEAKLVKEAELKMNLGVNKTELLENVYIPQLMGTTTLDQGMKATEWAGIRQVAWKMIMDPTKLKGVPDFARKGLRRFLEDDSLWHPASAGARISNFFYASTLGGNLSSATQNLFQPIITSGNFIGVQNTVKGMSKVISRIPRYLRLRKEGMSEAAALEKLFPDFIASGGELGTLTTEMALKESADIARGGVFGLRSLGAKVREGLLTPFRNTELFNRLSTFEGAKSQALHHGLDATQAISHAGEITNLTQMWGGAASTPSMMSNWWGPFKQFLTFPGKTAGMALGSVTPTLTSAGLQLGIGGPFNPGILGRAMMSSAIAYEGIKATTGADMSRSLLFGGLPIPEEQAVLSPLPVVPPVISLAAGTVQDIVSGSTENIQRSLPMLVPGGVALARMSQSYIPRLARLAGRGFADAENTRPDGMVPMYDARGNLTGHKSSYELFLSAIGIPGKLIGPNGDTQVHEVERYFIKQRDHIRKIRKGYIESFLDGEMLAAEQLQNKHMQDYGTPIEIRPQDWDASAMNRFVPRLERIAKSLPADVRGRFLMLAHTALSGQGERFLGADPLLFNRKRSDIAQILQAQGADNGPF